MTGERDRERDKVSVHECGPMVGPITYTIGTGSLLHPLLHRAAGRVAFIQSSEETKAWSKLLDLDAMFFGAPYSSFVATFFRSFPPMTFKLTHIPTDHYRFFRKKFIYYVTLYILVIL